MTRFALAALCCFVALGELPAQGCLTAQPGVIAGRLYGITWLSRTVPERSPLEAASVLVAFERRGSGAPRLDTIRAEVDVYGKFEVPLDSVTFPLRVLVEDPRLRRSPEKLASIASPEALNSTCLDLKAAQRPIPLTDAVRDLIRRGSQTMRGAQRARPD